MRLMMWRALSIGPYRSPVLRLCRVGPIDGIFDLTLQLLQLRHRLALQHLLHVALHGGVQSLLQDVARYLRPESPTLLLPALLAHSAPAYPYTRIYIVPVHSDTLAHTSSFPDTRSLAVCS